MVRAKKKFGQHFLRNRHVIERILNALEASPTERFLEIGPGPGTLTEPFTKRGFGITVVEKDGDMVAHLHELNLNPPVRVLHADFMEVPLEVVIAGPTKVFSNLPYNVSVPITARLLSKAGEIPLMVMMYQKEVAERIRALPNCKAYGIISVLVQAFYEFDSVFDVGPGSFAPPPKVMSQVVRFRARDAPLFETADLTLMEVLLKYLFMQRRKTLGSRLKKWDLDVIERDRVIEAFIAAGFDAKARPENLGPGDYALWLQHIKGMV